MSAVKVGLPLIADVWSETVIFKGDPPPLAVPHWWRNSISVLRIFSERSQGRWSWLQVFLVHGSELHACMPIMVGLVLKAAAQRHSAEWLRLSTGDGEPSSGRGCDFVVFESLVLP